MKPAARREAVTFFREEIGVSLRRACEMATLHRSKYAYRSQVRAGAEPYGNAFGSWARSARITWLYFSTLEWNREVPVAVKAGALQIDGSEFFVSDSNPGWIDPSVELGLDRQSSLGCRGGDQVGPPLASGDVAREQPVAVLGEDRRRP